MKEEEEEYFIHPVLLKVAKQSFRTWTKLYHLQTRTLGMAMKWFIFSIAKNNLLFIN